VVLKWKSTFIYCHFDICTPLKLINQNQIDFPINTIFWCCLILHRRYNRRWKKIP